MEAQLCACCLTRVLNLDQPGCMGAGGWGASGAAHDPSAATETLPPHCRAWRDDARFLQLLLGGDRLQTQARDDQGYIFFHTGLRPEEHHRIENRLDLHTSSFTTLLLPRSRCVCVTSLPALGTGNVPGVGVGGHTCLPCTWLTWGETSVLQHHGHRLWFGSRHYFGGLLVPPPRQGDGLGMHESHTGLGRPSGRRPGDRRQCQAVGGPGGGRIASVDNEALALAEGGGGSVVGEGGGGRVGDDGGRLADFGKLLGLQEGGGSWGVQGSGGRGA